jgi:hypothetical protein
LVYILLDLDAGWIHPPEPTEYHVVVVKKGSLMPERFLYSHGNPYRIKEFIF